MFQMKRPVTYSDVGPDYKVDMAQVINYFQDCSCFHSDSLGVGLENMDGFGKIWIMNSWQIIVDRYPKYGEQITVGTWPYDFKGPMGLRNFVIDDASGQRIARANSVWAIMDAATGRPARVDEELLDTYRLEPKEEMDYAPRKIKFSGDFELLESFKVRKDCLDTNQHVNNGRFVSMALEYVPQEFKVRQIRVEYKLSAYHGDLLVPKRQISEGKVVVLIENEQGNVCVITEFTE